MKFSRNVYRILALFTQFTVNMLVPIFLCSFLGYLLDEKTGLSCFFVIFFFVGALAGFRNVYVLARKAYLDSERKNDHEK